MTKALIVYDSLFGNTKTVAEYLAKGIEESGIEVDCMHINDIETEQIVEYDFLAIGGPTHMINVSKPMKSFLDKLSSIDLRGKSGFSFDTRVVSRMNSRRWFILENSAAKRIESRMKKMKISIFRNRESAIVDGREGPLASEVEDTFVGIGREIGISLVKALKHQVS
ncbi:MAG: flavodoxin family protein [Candidatus Thorarchaeota archaeon]